MFHIFLLTTLLGVSYSALPDGTDVPPTPFNSMIYKPSTRTSLDQTKEFSFGSLNDHYSPEEDIELFLQLTGNRNNYGVIKVLLQVNCDNGTFLTIDSFIDQNELQTNPIIIPKEKYTTDLPLSNCKLTAAFYLENKTVIEKTIYFEEPASESKFLKLPREERLANLQIGSKKKFKIKLPEGNFRESGELSWSVTPPDCIFLRSPKKPQTQSSSNQNIAYNKGDSQISIKLLIMGAKCKPNSEYTLNLTPADSSPDLNGFKINPIKITTGTISDIKVTIKPCKSKKPPSQQGECKFGILKLSRPIRKEWDPDFPEDFYFSIKEENNQSEFKPSEFTIDLSKRGKSKTKFEFEEKPNPKAETKSKIIITTSQTYEKIKLEPSYPLTNQHTKSKTSCICPKEVIVDSPFKCECKIQKCPVKATKDGYLFIAADPSKGLEARDKFKWYENPHLLQVKDSPCSDDTLTQVILFKINKESGHRIKFTLGGTSKEDYEEPRVVQVIAKTYTEKSQDIYNNPEMGEHSFDNEDQEDDDNEDLEDLEDIDEDKNGNGDKEDADDDRQELIIIGLDTINRKININEGSLRINYKLKKPLEEDKLAIGLDLTDANGEQVEGYSVEPTKIEIEKDEDGEGVILVKFDGECVAKKSCEKKSLVLQFAQIQEDSTDLEIKLPEKFEFEVGEEKNLVSNLINKLPEVGALKAENPESSAESQKENRDENKQEERIDNGRKLETEGENNDKSFFQEFKYFLLFIPFLVAILVILIYYCVNRNKGHRDKVAGGYTPDEEEPEKEERNTQYY